MKNSLLHNVTLLSLIGSFAVLPFNAAVAGIAFAVTGVLAILLADYGRNMEPLRVSAHVLPFNAQHGQVAVIRDAA